MLNILASMGRILIFSILLLASNAYAGIDLNDEAFKRTLRAYIESTEEVRYLKKQYPDQTVYLGGGAAVRIIQAVARHLTDGDKLPSNLFEAVSVNQNFDLYVVGSYLLASEITAYMNDRFQYTEERNSAWQATTLYEENGHGVIGSKDFENQNTDLASTGMVMLNGEVTDELPLVLATKKDGDGNDFYTVMSEDKNFYFDSRNHKDTTLAKMGKNPKIISAIRFLVNSLRFDLEIGSADLNQVKAIIDKFSRLKPDKLRPLALDEVLQLMDKILTKSLMEVADVPEAIELYKKLGLTSVLKNLAEIEGYDLRYAEISKRLIYAGAKTVDRSRFYDLSISVNSRDRWRHLTLVEGSRRFGGNLGSMLINFKSRQYRIAKILADLLDELNADETTRIKIAAATMGSRIAHSDGITENLDFSEHQTDCRACGIRSSIIADTFRIHSVIRSWRQHTTSLWKMPNGKYIDFTPFNYHDMESAVRDIQDTDKYKDLSSFDKEDYVIRRYLPRKNLNLSVDSNPNSQSEQLNGEAIEDFIKLDKILSMLSLSLGHPSVKSKLESMGLTAAFNKDIKEVLNKVKDGTLSANEAIKYIRLQMSINGPQEDSLRRLADILNMLSKNNRKDADDVFFRIHDPFDNPEQYLIEAKMWVNFLDPKDGIKYVLSKMPQNQFEKFVLSKNMDKLRGYLISKYAENRTWLEIRLLNANPKNEPYKKWVSSFGQELLAQHPRTLQILPMDLIKVLDTNTVNIALVYLLKDQDQYAALEQLGKMRSEYHLTLVYRRAFLTELSKEMTPLEAYQLIIKEGDTLKSLGALMLLNSIVESDNRINEQSIAYSMLIDLKRSDIPKVKRLMSNWLSSPVNSKLSNYLRKMGAQERRSTDCSGLLAS